MGRSLSLTFEYPEGFSYKSWGRSSVSANEVEISLEYSLGGMNYFTGDSIVRGYRVAVRPHLVTDKIGYKTKQFALGAGYYRQLKMSKRFSQSTLDKLFKATKEHFRPLADAYTSGDENGQLDVILLMEKAVKGI